MDANNMKNFIDKFLFELPENSMRIYFRVGFLRDINPFLRKFQMCYKSKLLRQF